MLLKKSISLLLLMFNMFVFAQTDFNKTDDKGNKNGLWNSGSFDKKTLPEKIYKEPKPIVIKENWDAEEVIKIDFNIRIPIPVLNNDNKNIDKPNINNTRPQNGKGIFGE